MIITSLIRWPSSLYHYNLPISVVVALFAYKPSGLV
jgi:hypothetical protein